jgi:hypothetical protein
MSASEIMDVLSLKARRNFTQNYLQPAIIQGFVIMNTPNKPTTKTQTYRLTNKGKSLKKESSKKSYFENKTEEKAQNFIL